MKIQGKDGKWYEVPDGLFGDRDGYTYVPALDRFRLDTWAGRVYLHMATHEWVTEQEIADLWNAPPNCAITERIRDLRKPRFGRMTVAAERVKGGLWKYRLEDFGDYGGDRCPPPSPTSTAPRVLTVVPTPSKPRSTAGWRIVPSSP